MSDLIRRQDAIDRINGTGYADQIKNNLILILRMLPAAQPECEWIRVEDDLPNPKDLVLVCNEFGGVYYGFYEYKDKWYTANNWLPDAWTLMPNVTHWMPLPQPPKEE